MKLGTLLLGVMLVVAPGPLWAGGTPVRVLEERAWVVEVLQAQAPEMAEDARAVVARTVVEEARAQGLDPALVLAVMKVESRFRPAARSRRGARGLMQVMPSVARHLTGSPVTDTQLADVETNVRLGVVHLGELIRTHGDLYAGLAAYNMGSRKVRAHLRARPGLHARDFRYTRHVLHEAAALKAAHPRGMFAAN